MRNLETENAGRYAYAASIDAQRRNNNNRSHYTSAQIRCALSVRDLIDTAFSYRNLYINYRQKFIAIKAEFARKKDALANEVIELFKTSGYDVVSTPQGLIVRISK